MTEEDRPPYRPVPFGDVITQEGTGYAYLASPYSNHPNGMQTAFTRTCRAAGYLISQGVPVFSPIAHSHPIAEGKYVAKSCHETWLMVDEPLVRNAEALIVLREPGFEGSYGVSIELELAAEEGLPIYDLWPGSALASSHAEHFLLTRR